VSFWGQKSGFPRGEGQEFSVKRTKGVEVRKERTPNPKSSPVRSNPPTTLAGWVLVGKIGGKETKRLGIHKEMATVDLRTSNTSFHYSSRKIGGVRGSPGWEGSRGGIVFKGRGV